MKLFIPFFFLIFLISCHKEEIPSSPIESDIIVEFRETLDTTSRKLTLFCKTEKIYPCINYFLHNSQNFKGPQLDISFNGVVEPEICLTASGPATASIQLPALDNGTHELTLTTMHATNNGKLVVSNEKVDLIFDNPQGLRIVRQSTQRVPANTYWGTIGYHTEITAPKVEEFLQKAAQLGAVFNKQAPGHYFYYEIDANGDIVANTENSGYYFVKAFIFQYTGDETIFKKNIKKLGTTYFDDMYINIETAKGEQIYNWD